MDKEAGNQDAGAELGKDREPDQKHTFWSRMNGWMEGHQALTRACSQLVTQFQHGGGGVLLPTSPSSSAKPAACPTIQVDSDAIHPETMSGATAQELVDSESPTLPPPTSGANHRSWLSPVLRTDQQ